MSRTIDVADVTTKVISSGRSDSGVLRERSASVILSERSASVIPSGRSASVILRERSDRRISLPGYELTGPRDAPLIVVLGGISATRHATATLTDPTTGWWQDIVGNGRAIDTATYRVLSVDYLDGGVTRDGRPQRTITTHDQAAALASVLDDVGVARAHAVVGASYGGMVALAFAEHFPSRLDRLVVISAAHEAHPMSTALRGIQRRIVELGIDTGRAHESLALARSLAMTTYRSSQEFADRFESEPLFCDGGDATFPVDEYLRHHGEQFAARWRPERFLALSLSCDLHRVDPRRLRTPTVIVAAEGDRVVRREQLEELANQLDVPHRFIDLPTKHGHDAFLTEPERLGSILCTAISTTIVS
ncbi:MAG: homoserine O-acetyltransferase [Gemmatimonadetes bacterium]|nr:homoserine O-acetyltransferase [Gemmatimonadota bacterium]